MSTRVFVDTNVLVYARDATEPQKQALAEQWMAHLWASRSGRLSVQVLNEFYVTVTQKLRPGMTRQAARVDCRALLSWSPVALEVGIVDRAWRLQDHMSLSFWDALIVSAAQSCDCTHLLTEDLTHGTDVDGLLVISPFVIQPTQLELG